jgi:hypothetical protein
MVTTTPSPSVRLLEEAGPDPKKLALIYSVEHDDNAKGMTLDQWAAWLRVVMPDRIHGYAPSLMPEKPTKAIPGSEAKILVMRERIRRGMSCCHPGDEKSTFFTDPDRMEESKHEQE